MRSVTCQGRIFLDAIDVIDRLECHAEHHLDASLVGLPDEGLTPEQYEVVVAVSGAAETLRIFGRSLNLQAIERITDHPGDTVAVTSED